MKFANEEEFRDWLAKNVFQVLEKQTGIKKGNTVLDYGCGSGTYTISASKAVGEGGKVYAVDMEPKSLKTVEKKASDERLRNIVTILAKKEEFATGLSEESVDVVLLYDVMQMIEDKPALLRELDRVLRPDGTLSIFPMHVGIDKMLEITNDLKLFYLANRFEMLLNFAKICNESL